MSRRTNMKLPADGYIPRIADGVLERALRSSGAVSIRGPEWCGKTATGERQSASQVFMQDPDRSATLLALADSKPSAILEGGRAKAHRRVANGPAALGRRAVRRR